MNQQGLLIGLMVLGVISVGVFSFVLLYGAPFLPTRRARITEVFELLDLQPGQTLVELGSGDGRILRVAAKQGINVIGYELNPVLAAWSWLLTWRHRRLVTIHCANYWHHPLPATDAIYTFLLQPYMAKLDTKIAAETVRPVKLVSFAFPILGKKPAQTRNGLYLYRYRPTPSSR